MVKFYIGLSQNQKALFWLILIAIIGTLVQIPLFFFYEAKGFSYPLGWILGSLTEIICYISILKFTAAMMPKGDDTKGIGLVAVSSLLRFAAYALVLTISAICTFKSEWFSGFNAFNFFTTFAGLFPLPFVLLTLGFFKKGNVNIHSSEEIE